MTLAFNTAWEVRPNGSDTLNGGGFVPGSGGTDYSQQDAAQYSFADLASSNGTGSTPQVTSASHSFAAADVGNVLRVTAGTNWTAGFYQIVSVSGGAATLDRACGTAAALSSGSYAVGGGFASPGFAASLVAAAKGSYVWLKGPNTYAVTSASFNVSGGCVNFPTLFAANAAKLIGYHAAHGDTPTGANRPTLQASNISSFFLCQLGGGCSVENVILDGQLLASGRGLSANGTSPCRGFNCLAKNFTLSGVDGNVPGACWVLCELTGCTNANGVPAGNSGSYLYCVAHDNTTTGMWSSTGDANWFVGCASVNNTGSGSAGFSFGSNPCLALGCLAYGNAADGFTENGGNAAPVHAVNCLAVANGGYGFNAQAATDYLYLLNCAGQGNGLGNYNGANIAAQDVYNFLALSGSPFNNPAGYDFSLNTTPGAGLALRGAGLPGSAAPWALPGLATLAYPDVGGVQHADMFGTIAGVPFTTALRYMAAMLAGQVSGAGTGREVFSDFAGQVAVTVFTDANGNRTGVNLS